MFLLLFMATSCIDEDLSRCGQNYSISYQLKLSLSLQETFDKEFITADEQALAAKLRTDLSSVLSDRAKLTCRSSKRQTESWKSTTVSCLTPTRHR